MRGVPRARRASSAAASGAIGQCRTAADAVMIEKLNHQIATGQVKNRGGQPVTEKIDGGLVRLGLSTKDP